MDTIFLNSAINKTSDTYGILLNLSDKINLKWINKYVFYQILTYTIHGKIWKYHRKTINLECYP